MVCEKNINVVRICSFSSNVHFFIISLILVGKNQHALDFRNISIKFYQKWCNLTKYFSFDKKIPHFKDSTFCHILLPPLLVKNISLKIISWNITFLQRFIFFSFICIFLSICSYNDVEIACVTKKALVAVYQSWSRKY